MKAAPKVSVIVSTRNRAQSLAVTLRSILADSSTTAREIIVVDNGSADDTQDVVRSMPQGEGNVYVRLIEEPRMGASKARNTGISAARGEVILFTDDDVVVSDGWADGLVAAFDDPTVGAAGGRILPRWAVPPPDWVAGAVAQKVTLPDLGEVPRMLTAPELPYGANMAIRAEALRMIDPPFHPHLGQSGSVRMGNEETHLLRQVAQHHRVAYRPDALVHHCVTAERVTWDQMRREFFQLGFGFARSDRLLGEDQLSLPVRLVRAARVCRGAWRTKRRNSRLSAPTPEDAVAEFGGYSWAGKHLEMLLGRSRPLCDWIAGLPV